MLTRWVTVQKPHLRGSSSPQIKNCPSSVIRKDEYVFIILAFSIKNSIIHFLYDFNGFVTDFRKNGWSLVGFVTDFRKNCWSLVIIFIRFLKISYYIMKWISKSSNLFESLLSNESPCSKRFK